MSTKPPADKSPLQQIIDLVEATPDNIENAHIKSAVRSLALIVAIQGNEIARLQGTPIQPMPVLKNQSGNKYL